MNPKDILTKELLEIEYIDNKLSTKKIAEKYDIKSDNSVFQAIKRYGLSRDSLKNITNKITKDWLYQKYIIEDLSAIDIAKELGMKRKSSILDKLHEFNIPIRKTTKTKKYIVSNNKRKMLYKDIRIDYWNSLIFGAKRRKISFEISIEYAWSVLIKQDNKCALSGISLSFCTSRLDRTSVQTASLDRIDSSKGYVEGNIQWIHKTINKMKMDILEKDFLDFCEIITKYRRK
jgi:predicted DNA-binding protein YlxM (UPF0122 family)